MFVLLCRTKEVGAVLYLCIIKTWNQLNSPRAKNLVSLYLCIVDVGEGGLRLSCMVSNECDV